MLILRGGRSQGAPWRSSETGSEEGQGCQLFFIIIAVTSGGGRTERRMGGAVHMPRLAESSQETKACAIA